MSSYLSAEAGTEWVPNALFYLFCNEFLLASELNEEHWFLGRGLVNDSSDPAPSCRHTEPKPHVFFGHINLMSLPGTSRKEG